MGWGVLAGGDGEFNGLSEELSAMQEQDAKAASEGSSQSRRFTLHAGVSVDEMDDLLILDVMVFPYDCYENVSLIAIPSSAVPGVVAS